MISVRINKKDTGFYTIVLARSPFAPAKAVLVGVGDRSARYYAYLERQFHKDIEFGLFFSQLIKMAEDTGGINLRVGERDLWCAKTFSRFINDYEAAGKLLLNHLSSSMTPPPIPPQAPHIEEMGVNDVSDAPR